MWDELKALSDEISSKIGAEGNLRKCLIAFQKKLDLREGNVDRLRHDLLNPLSALRGYSEIIQEENNDPAMEEIMALADRMRDLIISGLK